MKFKKSIMMVVYVFSLSYSLWALSLTETQHDKDMRGEQPLSLQFESIPVRNLLELLAEYKGVNLIVSDAVAGDLSVHLKDVTWDRALDAVLVMKNLEVRKKGSILFVTVSGEMNEQKEQERYGEEVRTEIFHVHFADAITLSELVKASGEFLSERGSIIPESRTNVLWLKDTPEKLGTLKSFLREADRPAKQVRIKAHIVNVDQTSLKELGLKFGTVHQGASESGADQLHMDMPLNIKDSGYFSVAIAKLGSDVLLNLELSALEKEGHAKMISNPELVTASRQTASIASGQEIPYQESTSSGATNTAFKKAVLSLQVTPIVTPDNKILLNLVVSQNKVSPLVVNGVPAVSTQEVQTQVLVNNGETIVLGGIYEERVSMGNERVPFFASIPVVGGLFRSKTSTIERRELLIFVRPEVL